MGAERVEVVIPVYDAAELTRRCIDSLYAFCSESIASVCAYDDASGDETRSMLDSLRHPGLVVHHAARNEGYGRSVNAGMARTRSDLVLVLNSDVEANEDFVAPLIEALRAESRLAAVVPAGNTFENYDLSRYATRGGCVVSYNLRAYAFLVRRAAFEEAGGFDPAFGAGYYEDTDLSRKLLRRGWWLGVHPRTRLWHHGHGSFGRGDAFRELLRRNRAVYLERYPEARRRVLLATAGNLTVELDRAVESVLFEGGHVDWLSTRLPPALPAVDLRWSRRLPGAVPRRLLRRRSADRTYTELWLGGDISEPRRRLLARLGRARGVSVKRV